MAFKIRADVWEVFLKQPLSRLESFGMTPRSIAKLEDAFGTEVAHIQSVTSQQALDVHQFGYVSLKTLRIALAQLLKSVEEELG